MSAVEHRLVARIGRHLLHLAGQDQVVAAQEVDDAARALLAQRGAPGSPWDGLEVNGWAGDQRPIPRTTAEENFLDQAEVVAERGTCPRLRVGALLARMGRQLLTGRNGVAEGEEHCGDHADGKACTRALHGEENAVAHAARFGVATEGATLYVTHSPCFRCAGLLIAAGVAAVVYRHHYRDDAGIARLRAVGIDVRQEAPAW